MATTYTAIPIFIKPILDSIFISKEYGSIQFIPLIIIAFIMVQGLSRYINNYGINWIGSTLTSDLQTAIFNKLLMLPSHYYEGQTNENLVSKLTSDVIQVTQDGARAASIFIKNILTIIGLSIWILYLNLELSLSEKPNTLKQLNCISLTNDHSQLVEEAESIVKGYYEGRANKRSFGMSTTRFIPPHQVFAAERFLDQFKN